MERSTWTPGGMRMIALLCLIRCSTVTPLSLPETLLSKLNSLSGVTPITLTTQTLRDTAANINGLINGGFKGATLSNPPVVMSTLPQPDADNMASSLLHVLEGGGVDYASTIAVSALATCAATLPIVAFTGKRAMERRISLELEVPPEIETPYPGGANSYSPVKADNFYRKRPLLVLSRLIGLLQATLSFQVKLLLDWLTGNLEANERERAREALSMVEELGPTFIKLGQALSIRTDLISEAYALELRKLQDAVRVYVVHQAAHLALGRYHPFQTSKPER